MKKEYKFLAGYIAIEYIFVVIMNKIGIRINSWIIAAIGLLLFFAPVLVLLYLLSMDLSISEGKRILSRILLVFIAISCIAGIIINILMNILNIGA